jgi:hypothetical protein
MPTRAPGPDLQLSATGPGCMGMSQSYKRCARLPDAIA